MRAQVDLKSQRDRNAYRVGGSAQPIRVATHTLGFGVALDNAAYRDGACKGSTVDVEGR